MKAAKIIIAFFVCSFLIAGTGCSAADKPESPKRIGNAQNKSEIHSRADFDTYLDKFNSRDYQGFLNYFADNFEMIHVGGNLRSREEVMKFYNFLHRYIKETVMVDRLVMDRDTIAMEARVQIE